MKTSWRLPLLFVFCTIVSLASAQQPGDDAQPAADPPAAEAPDPTPVVSEAEAEKAEELFQAGRKLFFQGKPLDAIKQLQAATKANPTKTGYMLLLSRAHRSIKQNARAIEVLEDILQGNSDHVEAGLELAELLTPQKEPERVIAILQPLLKLKHSYSLYHLLAEAHYEQEEFDEARRHFEEAVKLNPRNRADHYQLGNVYLARARFAKAANAYETAAALGLSSGAFHFKLASVYFNLHNYLGRVSEAEVPGGKAGQIINNLFLINAVPGKPDTWYVTGPKSAIFQAARAQVLGIDIFEIRFLEANIWLSAFRYANADPIYAELAEEVKEAEAGLFWSQWARTALGLGEFDNYISRLEKAIGADPNVYEATLADAMTIVARRHRRAGENDKYLEFLTKAVEVNPLSARLHLTLGDAWWSTGDPEKAIQQYKFVLELEPNFAQRSRLLNRIRGEGETVGVVAGPSLTGLPAPAGVALAGLASVPCLVSGEPSKPEFAMPYKGGKLHFCCKSCRGEFTGNLTQYSAPANLQLFATGQARVTICPVSGRAIPADTKFKVAVGRAEVKLCCGGCRAKVLKTDGDERVALIFNNASFAKSFALRPVAK